MRLLLLVPVIVFAGCIPPGRISTIPMRFESGEVWVYEGRASSRWQKEEADRMMAEHCWRERRGRAVMVNQTSQISGGSLNVTSFGASGDLYRDQRVMFACEPMPTPDPPEPGSPERAATR